MTFDVVSLAEVLAQSSVAICFSDHCFLPLGAGESDALSLAVAVANLS